MKPSSLTSRLLAGAALLACGFVIGPLLSGCGGGGAFAGTLPQPTSPQGHILFSRDNKLWLINADGTGERVVPNTDGLLFGKLSPDGRRIVSATTVDGNTDIYAFNIDGSNRQRLTTDAAIDSSPVWSGDGKKIAFCSGRLLNPSGERNVDIFTMNADGSEQKVLQNTDGIECPTSWSSDNSLITFSSNRRTGVQSEVFVVKSDGSEQAVVIANFGQDSVFTSDSRKVVYDSYQEGTLKVVDITGNNSRVIVPGFHPSVAPTGDYVVYRVFRDGVSGLFISKIDGTQTKLLVANADDPSWGR